MTIPLDYLACRLHVFLVMAKLSLVIRYEAVHFLAAWLPGQHPPKAVCGARRRTRPGIFHHPSRQCFCRLKVHGIVERGKRLEWRVGADPPHRAEFTAGHIEGDQAGIGRSSPDKDIDAT